MLEEMAAFFEARLDGYDAHMLENIEGARAFYPFTAAQLPITPKARILDLGCGTGLELEYFLKRNPTARVTGIDLSRRMLDALRAKFPEHTLELICGSYFDTPLDNGYDAAVSVESLHHFTQEEKAGLYQKLCDAIKPGGFFVLTDYFAQDEESEVSARRELERLKAQNGIGDGGFYHYDTPLTVEHEIQALLAGGFSEVEVLQSWGATSVLKAQKKVP